MARRTGSNAKGDLNELKVAGLLLEHGVAINALTASDTGWDLHCHVPDDLLVQATASGKSSWNLSGRTAHIQVKSASSDSLTVGTVRGWLTGTMSGVPTFMFGTLNNLPVFSAPDDLETWFEKASQRVPDTKKHRYTFKGKSTNKQTPLATHAYSEERFPSILQLWVHYPQVATTFPGITSWMNHEAQAKDPRYDLVSALVNAIWAEEEINRYTEVPQLLQPLEKLYCSAGLPNPDELATKFVTAGNLDWMLVGDGRVTRDTVERSIGIFVDPQHPEESSNALLTHIARLYSTNASTPGSN